MKDRKTLGHNDLINEVKKLLENRFSPQPQMLRRRIEQLIEVCGVVRSTRNYASYSKVTFFRENTLRECQIRKAIDIL
jgi:hypothetical protein